MTYRTGANSIALVTANLSSAASHAIVGLLAAAHLSGGDFGRYAIAIGASVMTSALADGGLGIVAMREVAAQRYNSKAVVLHLFAARLALMIVMSALAFTLAPLLWASSETVDAFRIGVVLGSVSSVSSLARAVFTGRGEASTEARIQIAERLFLVALVVPVAVQGQLVPILGLIVATRCLGAVLRLTFGLRNLPDQRDRPAMPAGVVFRSAAPLALSVVLASVYFHIDVLMLGQLAGEVDAGRYQAVVQILLLVYLVPESVSTVLVPAYAVLFAKGFSDEAIQKLKDALHRALTLGGIATLVLIALGPALVDMLYPTLTGLGPIIQVLGLACLVRFGSYVLSALMPSVGREKSRMVAAGAAAVTNVSLNLLLIPDHGALGAAIATVITEVVLFGVYAQAVSTRFVGHDWGVWIMRPVLPAAVVTGAAWLLLSAGVASFVVVVVALAGWEVIAAAGRRERPSVTGYRFLVSARASMVGRT